MKFYGYDIDVNKLPLHIGIIMDGNGRWAEKRNLPRVKGHEEGYRVLKKLIEFNKKLGVKILSVYAFSTENWKRPKEEVDFLMKLAIKLTEEYTDTLLKNDIKLMITGSRENLPEDLLKHLDESLDKTKNCKSYIFNIVFNYGGRREIVDSVKKIIKDYRDNKIDIDSFSENDFARYLYQADLPDVDLMIRTSGELRISNFLLWQIAYSEMYFTKKLWPDFKPSDLCKAIHSYQKRKRRFGGI